jgi:hypothetical protein
MLFQYTAYLGIKFQFLHEITKKLTPNSSSPASMVGNHIRALHVIGVVGRRAGISSARPDVRKQAQLGAGAPK